MNLDLDQMMVVKKPHFKTIIVKMREDGSKSVSTEKKPIISLLMNSVMKITG